MAYQIPVSKPVNNPLPTDVAGFYSLLELALDLRRRITPYAAKDV